MKKLGQKLSFLTKIMLVIGLLISNLSSLSVVFAYEATEDLVISLNDDTLKISYVEQLAEEVEAVNVKVYENYTYLDGESIEQVVTNYSLTAEELLAALEGELELVHETIFASSEVENFKLFDGTYNAKVEIIDVTDYSEEVLEETETTVTEEEETEVETTENENNVLENTEETTVLTDGETEDTVVINETVIAEGTYEEEIKYESGLNIKLFDSTGAEISLVDGKYSVSMEYSNVKVVAQILSGGLAPSDVFVYDDVQYNAVDLIELEFSSEKEFNGRLFGEYLIPVEVKVLKPLPVEEVESTETVVVPETTVAEEMVEVETTETEESVLEEDTMIEQYEEVVYTDSVSVMYESYELNSALLNMVAVQEGYGEAYLFYSDAKDGLLYVLSEFEETIETVEETVVTRTMLDVYNMLTVALTEEDTVEPMITYTLLKDGVDVLESYVPTSEEDTLEAYLATITLEDTVQIILSNEGLDITYDVVVAGDLDNNNILTEDDVLELINQFVGESEIADIDKSDVYKKDGEVNSLDVLYLNQVVKNQVWGSEITEIEVVLDASLEVKANDEVLSEENYLTSGDEFTVDYILSLTDYEVNGLAGVFNYDETLFELVSVEVVNEWIGTDYEGKFIYLGEESLTGPELEVTEPEVPETEIPSDSEEETTDGTETVLPEDETVETSEEEIEITPVDYVVVSATFRALSATNEESNNVITLEEIELFNSTEDGVTYYVLDQDVVSTEAIEVTASEDNSLQYLEIAGVEIALEEGVYEYEITVASDVTAVDLKYILGNVAASVTSEIYPEELVEGSNTVVITVTSETGVSQDYTITVIREEVEEETTTQVNYGSSSNTTNNDTPREEVVTPGTTDEEPEEKEEDSNLSRIVIIILILIVIAGLVYLIFKDEDDDETKKANKEVNKLKKESIESEVKVTNKTTTNTTNKNTSKSSAKSTSNKSSNTSKNRTSKNSSNSKNKER